MIRQLQVIRNKNVDSQYKLKADLKRGSFVQKDYATKELIAATGLEGTFILDRGLIVTPIADAFGTPSDYEEELENIKAKEFGNVIPTLKGERYASTEFVEADVAEMVVGKSLTVVAGKLAKSVEKTAIKSLGFIDDNGHKLLAFEIIA